MSAEAEFIASLNALLVSHQARAEDGSYIPKLLFADLDRQRRLLLVRFRSPPHCLDESKLALIQRNTEEAFYAESVDKVLALHKRLKLLTSLKSDPSFVAQSCRYLSFRLFRPWHQQEFYTCADVFSRLGGMRLICRWAIEWVQKPSWGTTTEVDALAMIMSACWNFCSNDDRSKHLLDAGIMDLLVVLFQKSCTPKEIMRKAMGLLWSVIEYGNIQEQVAMKATGILEALLHICDHNSEDPLMSELALGPIHMCASNFRCLPAFTPNVAKYFHAIQHSSERFPKAIMVGYMGCLALGSLLTNLHRQLWMWVCECAVREHDLAGKLKPCASCQKALGADYTRLSHALSKLSVPATKLIRKWLANHRPQDVRKVEFGHYVWRFIFPFSVLLRCQLPEVRIMGAFSLANLAQGSDNRDLLVAEEGASVPVLQCASHSHVKGVSDFAKEAMKPFHLDGVQPLSLKELCVFYVSEHFRQLFHTEVVPLLPKSLHHQIVPFVL